MCKEYLKNNAITINKIRFVPAGDEYRFTHKWVTSAQDIELKYRFDKKESTDFPIMLFQNDRAGQYFTFKRKGKELTMETGDVITGYIS
jgi:hypothetical protein